MTAPEATADPTVAAGDGEWRRLEPGTALASTLRMAGACVAAGATTLLGITAGGHTDALAVTALIVLAGTLVLGGAVFGAEHVRLRRTRFRVGPQRVELHSGVFVRARSRLARDRVRTVEIQADPVARVLGLATLRLGTGQRASFSDDHLELRALRRPTAEALRRELLERGAAPETRAEGVLATFDPRWISYAPLSFLTVVLGAAAGGVVLKVSDWFGLQSTVVDTVLGQARHLGVLWSAVVGLAIVLVVGTVASLAVFLEAWWAYRLEREPTGTLQVGRGLLTRRSTTLEERRLRGIALVEPLGVRSVGAARVDAVATGLHRGGSGRSGGGERRSDPSGLLPAAPRAFAERVAAAVLREPVSPTATVHLRPHPVAARARRVRWATGAALLPALVLAVLGVVLHPGFGVAAVVVAVVGLVIGRALGRTAYRSLGHGLGGAYLVARAGVSRRRTVALRRDGIIGWSVRQSIMQRRAGLATLWFTTAGGDQAYAVHDLAAADAAVFAREALGAVVTPFVTGLGNVPLSNFVDRAPELG